MEKIKIGFLPAHRDLMDEEFAVKARKHFLNKISNLADVDLVCPDTDLTKNGLVRDHDDALKVIKLFHDSGIDCLIIGAMTFGDERSALTIAENFSHLPLFIFATAEPEIPDGKFFKSAAACGLLPISFGLTRRNIKYSFGGVAGFQESVFDENLKNYTSVVNAFKHFKNARIGMIGSRPNAFEVCAVNEALMIEKFRQKISYFDLVELKNEMENIADDDIGVLRIVNEILSTSKCAYDAKGLMKVAKLESQLLKYINDFKLDTLAIQCWTSIQKYIGVTPCLTNGRIASLGYPVACEGDINNSLAMLLQQKMVFNKKTPMLLDILALHPEEKNFILLWHCGNVPIDNKGEKEVAKVLPQCPWEGEFGKERAAAAIEFLIKSGKVTINSLVEHNGIHKMLNFKGKILEKSNNFRGAWGWLEVEDRDLVYKTIVNEGFTHHASVMYGDLSENMKELCKYLGIEFISV